MSISASQNPAPGSGRKAGLVSVQTVVIIILAILVAAGGLYLLFMQERGERVGIVRCSPIGETPLTTNITVEFSHTLVPDSLVDVQLDDELIRFTPELPGKFRWIAPNTLRFYPNVRLAPATEYSAVIQRRVAADAGYVFDGETAFTFNTAPLRVNSAYVNFEYRPGARDKARLFCTIEFNYEMDPQTVLDFVKLSYEDGGDIPCTLVSTQPSKIINLEAQDVRRTKDDTRIILMVKKGITCIGGHAGMKQDYVRNASMPGQEDLKVVRMQPRKTSRKTRYIEVQFNMPIQAETAKAFIQVDPPIKYNVTATHHYLQLAGDFKDGKTYQVTVRKGLTAIDGSVLERQVSNAVSFRGERIPPQVGFVGDGFYLTKSGQLNLGLSTINVGKVSLEIRKVFANNLVYLLNHTDPQRDRYGYFDLPALGKRVRSADLTVQPIENEEVVTPINIRDYLHGERKGIFSIVARIKERRWNQVAKWVIATDMGIVAKKSGDHLMVWVNSLADLTPVANVALKLISRNNQTLLTAKTNRDGIAVFTGYKALEEQGLPPYLITAQAGDDLSFLELQRRRIPTSDFDVAGKPTLLHGYEAFLYNQRGVYRPGETAFVTAVVRAENAQLPPTFPVILNVKTPDNRILVEHRATLNNQGAAEFKIAIPAYAKTGGYVARLLIGGKKEIGRTTFNVEEFIPDRMKVKVTSDQPSYSLNDRITFNVEAVTLFGPPAANRQVEADLEIEHFPFAPPNWKSFTFNDAKKKFSRIKAGLPRGKLDQNGKYAYHYQIPKNLRPPSALRGILSTTVLEPGGRGVSAYTGVIIHPYSNYVGLRKAKEGYAEPDKPTDIELILVNPDGLPVAGQNVEIAFYKISWHSILKRVSRSRGYRYVSEQTEDLLRTFTVLSEDRVTRFQVLPKDYGRYLVVARNPESGASASLYFYASGWGYAPWAMEHPDRIQIDLDKSEYSPGETATVQVRAPFSGKLLLTVERHKVLDYQVVEMTDNTATIQVPIEPSYKPNVYVSAHLIQSTESLERDTPARAFGVAPLMVNTRENRLRVDLQAADDVRPNGKLEVEVRVSGYKGQRPYFTLAAVDEGICQLTAFETPDAHDFFFGKKRLGVESYDIYGAVLPEITASSLTSVGGDVEAQRKRQLTPVSVTRVKPVALWSGLLETDNKGRATLRFDLPQFNGTLRLMAVAFAGDRFGNAEKKVFVREPIVLTPTFPRFIGSGDNLTIPVNIYNGTGADATFSVHLGAQGPVAITGEAKQSVVVAAGAEKQVYFDVQADNAAGEVQFNLSARTGHEKASMSVDVPLRPPVPFITLSGAGTAEASSPGTFVFPGDWFEDTANFRVTVSSFPAIKFSGSLQYLLSYPYGCVEQVTSKVFPLLAFNDIARLAEPELFKRNSAAYYVEEGIRRLENMQLTSGAFSYWPSGRVINNWGSVYAAHFLVEARKNGYLVSDRVYNNLMNALSAATRNYQLQDRHRLQTAVYACYVLALAGKPAKSTMLYFKNNALENLSQDAQFQLAGAFALAGDRQTAMALLPKSAGAFRASGKRETGRNFNSPVRAQAIMLDILAQIDAKHPMVPLLVKKLTDAASRHGRWGTTQENAFAFLALGKILRGQSDINCSGTLTVDGKTVAKFTTEDQEFTSGDWGGKQVSLDIRGKGTCYFYWRAEGIPAGLHTKEFDNDLQVRRRYLDKNGNAVLGNMFRQGDLVIAEISVKPTAEDLHNVVVVDMLPAGLEIENPRLQSRKGIEWIGNKNYHPAYMDIRDDRLILFGNFRRGQTATFYYALRAVTRGTFTLPPVRAEAMYAPETASVASSGEVVVEGL